MLPIDPHEAPISGIYFLHLKNRIVFVGKSPDVKSRVTRHYREKERQFDRASYIPVSVRELNRKEKEYIRKYKPSINGDPNSGCPTAILEAAVSLAVGYLEATDESGISPNEMYARSAANSVAKFSRAEFFRILDVDPRVSFDQSTWLYTRCTLS